MNHGGNRERLFSQRAVNRVKNVTQLRNTEFLAIVQCHSISL